MTATAPQLDEVYAKGYDARVVRQLVSFIRPHWRQMLFALVLMLIGESARGSNIQSVVVGSVAIIVSGLVFMIGLLGEILAINRHMNEETMYHLKRVQFDKDRDD